MNDFLKRHYQVVVIGFLVAILSVMGFSSVATALFPNAANISEDVISALIGDVLNKRVNTMEESLVRIEKQLSHADDYSIILLTLEMNTFRTASEVDERVDFLLENQWNA